MNELAFGQSYPNQARTENEEIWHLEKCDFKAAREVHKVQSHGAQVFRTGMDDLSP